MPLPKPEACRGCPAFGNGLGWVPDELREGAPVLVYAQEPGPDEVAGRQYLGHDTYQGHVPAPLIGRTGHMMDGVFLPLAGLAREDCSFGNTLRCRGFREAHPVGEKGLPPVTSVLMRKAIEHCTRAHFRLPEGVKVILAQGEYATFAMTGVSRDFGGWRGYMLPFNPCGEKVIPHTNIWNPWVDSHSLPVFVTHHLAYLFKEPTAELPAKRDWNKMNVILKREWPISMPQFSTEPPDVWPTYAAFDTEFDDRKVLVRYSLATRDKVWVIESERVSGVATLPGSVLVMHNAPADLPHASKIVDLNHISIEDDMYAHSVLWTGKVETDDQKGKAGGAMSHTLNFLGSMYGRLNRWKHLRHVQPKLYSGADAFGTLDVWETGLLGGIKGELERDPGSKWVYEHLMRPLVPIIVRNQQRGIASNPAKVEEALKDIVKDQEAQSLRAQAYCGFPINLRSPKQVAHYLYDVEKLKVRRHGAA